MLGHFNQVIFSHGREEMENLDGIIADAKSTFDNIIDLAALDQAKARFLGKSGALTERLKEIGRAHV